MRRFYQEGWWVTATWKSDIKCSNNISLRCTMQKLLEHKVLYKNTQSGILKRLPLTVDKTNR